MDSPWFAASNGRTFVVMNADTRDALVDELGLTVTFDHRSDAGELAHALNCGDCFPAAPNNPDHPMWQD